MITNRSSMNQSWTDLNSPTKEEVDSLVLSQDIDPIIAKDLLTPTPTQHALSAGEAIYAVLYVPAFKHSHTLSSNSQEIDFIISAKGVTTVRYDSIDALHYFAKQIEVEEILHKGQSYHIFFRMINVIYKSMTDELAYIEDWMKEIEKNIFEGYEKDMVFAISNVGKNLLNFKRITDPHYEVFQFIKNVGGEKFGNEFQIETESLINEWQRLVKRLNNQIDLMVELRETNNSMLSTKQNEIMKIFTILAFVTFPLSLIASIFGMNTAHIPIVGWPNDFWIVIGIMFIMSLAMFAYFKYKKWI